MEDLKKCSKCGEILPVEEFSKNKATKDGLQNKCKKCSKKYYQENKENFNEYRKKYQQENKEQIKERQKKYKQENKEKIKEYNKEYNKKYYQENKEYHKEWYKTNNKRIKEIKKEWFQNNKERINKKRKKRRNVDVLYKLSEIVRSRTASAFKSKNFSKTSKTQKILGCSWETLSKHIERQFKKGMTWENQGEWHIDHIIPLASAKTEEELIKLAHYTNLQPLWAEENFSKNDTIPEVQIPLRL